MLVLKPSRFLRMTKSILTFFSLLSLLGLQAQYNENHLSITAGYTDGFGLNATVGMSSINSEVSFTTRNYNVLGVTLLNSTLLEYRYILEPEAIYFPGEIVDFQLRGFGGVGLFQVSDKSDGSSGSVFMGTFGAGGELRFNTYSAITPIVRINLINYWVDDGRQFDWFKPNFGAGIKIEL